MPLTYFQVKIRVSKLIVTFSRTLVRLIYCCKCVMYFNYRNPHHGRTVRFGPLWSALDEKISVRRPLPSLRRTVRLNFWSASVRFGRNFKVRCPRPSLRRTALGEKTWSSVRLGPPSAFVHGRPSSSYDVWLERWF